MASGSQLDGVWFWVGITHSFDGMLMDPWYEVMIMTSHSLWMDMKYKI